MPAGTAFAGGGTKCTENIAHGQNLTLDLDYWPFARFP
jgi:hypothetical protein